MKKSAIIFVLLLTFFVGGCSNTNSKTQENVMQAKLDDKEVSLSKITFPIESSELLNLFQGYSFYDTLHIVVINQMDELENIVDKDKSQTLYLLANTANESQAKKKDTSFYQYGSYLVIYQGENEEIQNALKEKLNQ